MRIPLLAGKTIVLEHRIRSGTGSSSYTTIVSGVSCWEVSGAASGSGSGFDPSNSTGVCIFVGYSKAAPQGGAETAQRVESKFLNPEAFRAAEAAQRASHWTLSPEDKITLPSGRTGTVMTVQDNRSGRCPHWYVEVR